MCACVCVCVSACVCVCVSAFMDMRVFARNLGSVCMCSKRMRGSGCVVQTSARCTHANIANIHLICAWITACTDESSVIHAQMSHRYISDGTT